MLVGVLVHERRKFFDRQGITHPIHRRWLAERFVRLPGPTSAAATASQRRGRIDPNPHQVDAASVAGSSSWRNFRRTSSSNHPDGSPSACPSRGGDEVLDWLQETA